MTVIIFNVIVDSELRLLYDETWITTKINNQIEQKALLDQVQMVIDVFVDEVDSDHDILMTSLLNL